MARVRSSESVRAHLAVHAVLIISALAMVFPFFWQVMTTFKTQTEALQVPPQLLPATFGFDAYRQVLQRIPFVDMFNNSVLSVVTRTVAQLIFCSMAGYAFARLRFPFRGTLFVMLLAIMMVPREIYLIPQTEIMKSVGLLDTVTAMIAPGLFSAFGTFLMRQFFLTLPESLAEAARLDGANRFQVFYLIMLPLAKPGLIALAIFTALWTWNELLWPLVIISTSSNLNLSAGISTLSGEYVTDYPMLMAGSLMAELPMIVLFLVLQKRFIEGIATTGMK
ncbi:MULTISPECIES: carbohydrate ABC transporter permease [Mesorhizobium]|uniref:Carbohydrate ABC transporter permease n=1 Tax=Mesorhizobium denitrificans TaxID=2294114 RepID=A0A371XD97_9HYPH|nr:MULTISPECIES: carbohydrate ABC transporter permease [Mesorhizobium]RFC67004.1 carbohydrate ABC transporter permease [Mesorhizobium denitrificans]